MAERAERLVEVEPAPAPAVARLPDGRWRPLELAFWLLPVACFFLFPGYLVLWSQVFVTALLALSLDLVLGYAGLVSLGHAAFFGVGAYTAGLLAAHGWGEPLTGLVAAAAAGAAAGFGVSFLVVRGQDLARLMVTLGVGLLFFEGANEAASITGGVDGLSGVRMWRLLGLFPFDLEGRTAFVYALAVLLGCFAAARRLVASPFGLSLRGIRENARRMPALGAPVGRRLVAIFTVSAGMAGIAGGVLAQTTQFVGLDALGFTRSAEVIIVLVLGGTGRLYGALVGAGLFMLAQDWLSGIDPVYWQFWLGLLLVVVVLFGRGGVLGGLQRIQRRLLPGSAADRTGGCRVAPPGPSGARSGAGSSARPCARGPVPLRTVGLTKAFGALVANAEIGLSLPGGARHALIGPNGAGKTTLIDLLTGVQAPTAGDVFLGDERVTHLPQHERARRGMTRTYQISALFPGLTVLESVVLAVCERRGRATAWWTPVASRGEEVDEALALLDALHLGREAGEETRFLPYGKQRLLEVALALATRPRILLLDEPAAGIPAGESAEVLEVVSRLPEDVTILLIEHDMELVFRFARRITVLVGGRVLTEGTPAEIAGDRSVREVYLGEAQRG